jgi:hypothetical protein
LAKLTGNVAVKCIRKGCTFVGDRKRWLYHANKDCTKRIVVCPHSAACRELMESKDTQEHSKVCPFAQEKCPLCDSDVTRRDLEDHKMSLCNKRLVNCIICPAPVTADAVEDHKLVCPGAMIPCEYLCGKRVRRDAMSAHLDKPKHDRKHVLALKKALDESKDKNVALEIENKQFRDARAADVPSPRLQRADYDDDAESDPEHFQLAERSLKRRRTGETSVASFKCSHSPWRCGSYVSNCKLNRANAVRDAMRNPLPAEADKDKEGETEIDIPPPLLPPRLLPPRSAALPGNPLKQFRYDPLSRMFSSMLSSAAIRRGSGSGSGSGAGPLQEAAEAAVAAAMAPPVQSPAEAGGAGSAADRSEVKSGVLPPFPDVLPAPDALGIQWVRRLPVHECGTRRRCGCNVIIQQPGCTNGSKCTNALACGCFAFAGWTVNQPNSDRAKRLFELQRDHKRQEKRKESEAAIEAAFIGMSRGREGMHEIAHIEDHPDTPHGTRTCGCQMSEKSLMFCSNGAEEQCDDALSCGCKVLTMQTKTSPGLYRPLSSGHSGAGRWLYAFA